MRLPVVIVWRRRPGGPGGGASVHAYVTEEGRELVGYALCGERRRIVSLRKLPHAAPDEPRCVACEVKARMVGFALPYADVAAKVALAAVKERARAALGELFPWLSRGG